MRTAFMGANSRVNALRDIRAILGSGDTPYVIIPIGDQNYENGERTTVTTIGQGSGDGLVFTYSEAVSAWDTPPKYRPNQLHIPYNVSFNAIDEEADTPDATFWSRGDGTNDNPVSFGAWVSVVDTGTWKTILVKGDLGEWDFRMSPSEEVQLVLADASAGAFAHRVSGVAVPISVTTFVVATYDGAGGASAADTINLYVNGALSNGAITNAGSYVAMENTTGLASLAERPVVPERFNGRMCGGPLGPFFTHQELSASQVAALYRIGVIAQK